MQIIHTRSRKTDRKALRSALVLSASDDQQVTPIEIIQKYRTQEVEIEGKKFVTSIFNCAAYKVNLKVYLIF